jgi:pimeloyl-ACP methyl ester carboxylesterase
MGAATATGGYGARMRRTAIVLTLVLAAALTPATAAGAQDVRKGPKGDAFYTPPKPFTGRHGGLIWARRQTGSDALKRNARLMLYRSNSLDGDVVAVSGSLTLPRGPRPRGGWPIVTYAHGTAGVADGCAPTRGYDENQLVSYADPLVRRFLDAGYAVVRTDYEGLGTPGVHPFLVGRSEGRSVLDAVRAARELEPRLSNRFVIAGHSQGGHAALFAAALAPRWVPDLKLRGTVALAPPSHLREQFEATRAFSNPGGGLGSFVALGLRAVDAVAPQVGVPQLLTDRARGLFSDTLRRCHDTLSAADSFGGVPLNEILRGDADLGALLGVIGAQDPEHLTITSRVRLLQGTADGTVFAAFTNQLVAELRGRGTKLAYTSYDGVTHAGVIEAGGADATRWIRRRLK